MFSAKKRPFSKESGPGLWGKGKRLLSSKPWSGIRPRVSMRVWLTALFVLVTAVAAVTAYEIVRPLMEAILDEGAQDLLPGGGKPVLRTSCGSCNVVAKPDVDRSGPSPRP
jgi:hypothetical protein